MKKILLMSLSILISSTLTTRFSYATEEIEFTDEDHTNLPSIRSVLISLLKEYENKLLKECPKTSRKEYEARPEVKARRKECSKARRDKYKARPEVKKRRKEYEARPEVKTRRKEYEKKRRKEYEKKHAENTTTRDKK